MKYAFGDVFSMEAWEGEKHVHNRERWFGKSGDQSGNDWAVPAGLLAFVAISGNADFGQGATDHAKVLGTDDTPAIADMVKFDIHKFLITAMPNDTPWILRVIYGSGTMADMESAGQYSDFMIQTNPAGAKAGGVPVPIMMPRADCGVDQIWVRAKNATDDAEISFFIGIHEYTK